MSASPAPAGASTDGQTVPPGQDLRRLAGLAWPVLVGQLAVLGFSTVDTLLVARAGTRDLAALGIAGAIYMSVFVGLMGVVAAVSPIVGQLYGAGQRDACGEALRQARWLALMLCLPGCALLLAPDPFLVLSRVSPEVEPAVRAYLQALAAALPAALLFATLRGFATALARTRLVMRLQLAGLALKVPLSMLLVSGLGVPGDRLYLPPLGVLGCGLATATVMWAQTLLAERWMRRDPTLAAHGLADRHWGRPQAAALLRHLRLGVPMGLSILIEVTGFTFMALIIARLGTTAVAGHQIVANLAALLFMVPLAQGHASAALVAVEVGAGRPARAHELGRRALILAAVVATLLGLGVALGREPIARLYTTDPAVLAVALPLLGWVAVFHAVDAVQAVAAFVLRAWHVVTAPMLIYAGAVWGVGLGGGYWLAVDGGPWGAQGAPGLWMAATAGLALAAAALLAWIGQVHRRQT